MKPFEPIGDVARWRVLHTRLLELGIGDVLTYEDIELLLECDTDTARSAVYRAQTELERHHKRTVENVRGVGYRVAHPKDHERLGRDKTRSAKRALHRAGSKYRSADRSMLTNEERARIDALELSNSRMQSMVSDIDARTRQTEQLLAETREEQSSLRNDVEKRLRALEEEGRRG